MKRKDRLSFLDVLMIRDKNNIETKVYHKSTNNNIYLNWISDVPKNWKISTIRTLVKRAYDTCSTNEHIEIDFHEQNQCPFWTISKVFYKIKRSSHQQLQEQHQQELPTNSSNEGVSNSKKNFLLLPYKGKRIDNI